MTPSEAYKLLEVEKSISDDDLKSHYKDLAKKYHPDLYKEDPDKFKQINEAYQLITDYRANPSKYQTSPFHRVDSYDTTDFPFEINLSDIFSNFTGRNFRPNKGANPPARAVHNINLTANLSFKECALGKEHDLEYERDVKCDDCNGAGSKTLPNDCKNCDGFGRIQQSNGNMIFTRSCDKCHGFNTKKETCKKCAGKSVLQVQTKLSVQIPSGLADKSTLKLQGAGNYSASNGIFGDHYTDVLLTISVEKDPVLRIENNDVLMDLQLTLLEALEGCKKSVKTIHGEETIEIKPMSRHKEEVVLKGLGLKGRDGNQRVVFNVIYDKVEELIKVLKEIKE